jgi:RNA-binding protein YhbY
MKTYVTKFQIGKNGITPGVLTSLSQDLKIHRQVRVTVLKSAGRNKERVKELASELKEKLPMKCSSRIIGFIIILAKTNK